jgi:hypothetical protein
MDSKIENPRILIRGLGSLRRDVTHPLPSRKEEAQAHALNPAYHIY